MVNGGGGWWGRGVKGGGFGLGIKGLRDEG